MGMTQQAFEQVVILMDAANSEDPNIETADGKEWPEAKWIDIIRKSWNKMSDDAHDFALSGELKLPELLIPLI